MDRRLEVLYTSQLLSVIASPAWPSPVRHDPLQGFVLSICLMPGPGLDTAVLVENKTGTAAPLMKPMSSGGEGGQETSKPVENVKSRCGFLRTSESRDPL